MTLHDSLSAQIGNPDSGSQHFRMISASAEVKTAQVGWTLHKINPPPEPFMPERLNCPPQTRLETKFWLESQQAITEPQKTLSTPLTAAKITQHKQTKQLPPKK
jgi:hypothetical protein